MSKKDTSLVKGKPSWDELDGMYQRACTLIATRKPRVDAVKFAKEQLARRDAGPEGRTSWHYGIVELRKLLDFIYGGPPEKHEELNRE